MKSMGDIQVKNATIKGEMYDLYVQEGKPVSGSFVSPDDKTVYHILGGLLHRTNGPATISPAGTKQWYKNGKFHRDGDKPAMEHANGVLYYAKDGELHRDGNKPAIVVPGKREEYYIKGLLHRTNGPAIEYIKPDGSRDGTEWFNKGQRVPAGTKTAKARLFPAALRGKQHGKQAKLPPPLTQESINKRR